MVDAANSMEAVGTHGRMSRLAVVATSLRMPLESAPTRVRDDLASSAVIIDDRLIVALRSGGVAALQVASGNVIWERRVGKPNEGHGASLMVRGDSAWVHSEREMIELAVSNGRELARHACPPLNLEDGVLVGDRVVCSDPMDERGIFAWRLGTAICWERGRDDTDVLPALAANADTVLTTGKGLIALDLASGQKRWRIDAVSGSATSPVVAGEMAIAKLDGALLAADLATGEIRWRVPLAPGIRALPTVTDDGEILILDRTLFERRSLASGALLAGRPLLDDPKLPTSVKAAFFTVPCITREHVIATAPTGPLVVFDRESLEVVSVADVRARRAYWDMPLVGADAVFLTSTDGALDRFGG